MTVSTALAVSLTVLTLVLPPAAPAPITIDSFSKVPRFCMPFLRNPNGTRIMREDIASYYARLQCPVHSELTEAFSISLLGMRKLQLATRQEKDAAICHGVVELLSLIEAYNWTPEMCNSSILGSDDFSRGFCDSYDDTKVHIGEMSSVYQSIGYDRLAAVASFLGNLQDCGAYCEKGTDSAFCSTFKEASTFFIKQYEDAKADDEEVKVGEIPELVQEAADSGELKPLLQDQTVAKGGSTEAATSPPPTNATTSAQPAKPTLKPETITFLNDHPEFLKNFLPRTQHPGAPTLPPMLVNTPSDSHTTSTSPTVATTVTSHSSQSTTESVTGPEVAITVQSSEATTPKDSTQSPEKPSTSTEEPSNEENPKTKSTGTTDHEGREGGESDSEKGDGEADYDPLDPFKFYGNGSNVPDYFPGDGLDSDDELEEKEWEKQMELEKQMGLEEEEKESVKSNEEDDKKGELGPQEGGEFVGHDVEHSDSSDGSGSSKGQSYGAWHFFTIFLFLAVVAVVGYLVVHNRKRIREGVSSYVSDKKRRRRGREYKPLIG